MTDIRASLIHMSDTTLLHAEGIATSYGRYPILHGVELSLERGELVALLGLNGCGKTTLIKSLCHLISMQSGTCFIEGTDCSELNEKQLARLIAYIPQRGTPIYGRSVRDVVLMGYNACLSLLDSPSLKQRERADSIIDRLGISELSERDYGSLSEGQKQLVILARAIVQDTPVMMMDEPDSALDFVNKSMVLEKIRELIRTEHKGGLIALHDPNFAMRYCDRLLLMRDGAIIDEVTMSAIDRASLERALSQIYGDIILLEHAGGYVMTR